MQSVEEIDPFGEFEGCPVRRFVVTSPSRRLKMCVISYGAIIQSFQMGKTHGDFTEVQVGMDSLEGYLNVPEAVYLGATIGRYGNRIANGTFTIDGKVSELDKNEGGTTTLHGGSTGFHAKIWEITPIEDPEAPGVSLSLVSPDGDNGFPGSMTTTVNYQLSSSDQLIMSFRAVTTQPTVVNLTNHVFWNLSGWQQGKDVKGNVLQLPADRYLEVDEKLIPTGRLLPVDSTPFDFRKPRRVGEGLLEASPQGYDQCFSLMSDREAGPMGTEYAGDVYDPDSGRGCRMYCSHPGVQLYTRLYKDLTAAGGHRMVNGFYSYCLEFQDFPDAPNQDGFPSTTLRPGEAYERKIIHEFYFDRQGA